MTTDRLRAYRERFVALNPGYFTKKKEEWLKKNQIRAKVRDAVRYAVRTGKLKKLPCWVCGELKVHGHHVDYGRPLDVVWLCRAHHEQAHRESK